RRPQRTHREQGHCRRDPFEIVQHICSPNSERRDRGARREKPLRSPRSLRSKTVALFGYAAAVDFFASTSPNTCTALVISSIVPSEMRACVFSNGGKSGAAMTPLARHA